MKKRFKFLFILMFVVYSFTLAACDIEGLLGKLPFDIPFLEQKEEYNIYFYVEDEIYHEITIKEGESFELPSEPYIEGKEFIGWYYADGEEFSIDYVINGNVDLYAKFEGDEIDEFITLYFYVDGKYFRSETYEYGDNFTRYPIPTKEGMVFDYWALSDGTKFDYHNKVTESFNLYAVFKKVDNPVETVIVNFYVDDKLEKTQEYIKDKFFENIFTPYKEGYTFSHWENKNGKKYDYNTLLETDVDLYAVFNKVDYPTPEGEKITVSFYVDGKLEKTQEYIKDKFFYECFTPYKEGYTFSHWEDKYGIKYDINTLLKDNVNLYAVFEKIDYSTPENEKVTVNFYVDDKLEKTQEYIRDEFFYECFTPYKEGYTFSHWEDKYGTKYDINTLLKDNVNLYAVFEENEPTNLNKNWVSTDPGIYTLSKTYDGFYFVKYNKPKYFEYSSLSQEINIDLNGYKEIQFELLMPKDSSFILKIEGPNGYLENKYFGSGKIETYSIIIDKNLSEEELKSFDHIYIFIDYYKETSSGQFYIYNVTPIKEEENTFPFEFIEAEDFVSITKYIGVDTDKLVFPGYINNKPVMIGNKIEIPCFDSLKEVIFEEGVFTIDAYAFANSNLEKITIPSTMYYIGNRSFENNDKLTIDKIPNNIDSIGIKAFTGVYFYKPVIENTIFINKEAFNNATGSILYKGTKEEWDYYETGFEGVVYFYSETEPTLEGNYWHYNSYGSPVSWDPVLPENNDVNNLNKNWYCDDIGIYFPELIDDDYYIRYNKPLYYAYSFLYTNINIDLNGYKRVDFELTMPENSNFILKLKGDFKEVRNEFIGTGNKEIYSLELNSNLTEKQLRSFKEIIIYIDYDIEPSSGEFYIHNVRGINDFEYCEYEDYVEITKYNGDDMEVIIPSVINGKPVTLIGAEAFIYNMTITSVEIPDTVTVIGFYSFAHCTSLISVKLPENLAIIFNNAFYNCISLESIDLPNKLEEIDNEAFALCISLKYIVIPYSVKFVDVDVFGSCESLRVYTEHTSEEWKNVQSNNSIIDLNITYIDGNISWMYDENGEPIEAYLVNYYIDNILIYSTHIGSGMELGTIDQPVKEGYEFIGWYYEPFDMFFTDTMTVINPLTLVAKFKELVDFEYKEYEDYIEITKYVGNDGIVEIPSKINGKPITTIGEKCFNNCINITSINMSDNIATIEARAFMNCTLDYIIVPNCLIDQNAFENYNGIILFKGSEFAWLNQMVNFSYENVYFYSDTEPTEKGNYWHYVDGEPVIWPEYSDFEYNEYDDYIEITGYTGTEVEILIPNYINSKPVKIIGEYSLDHSSFISVVIGDNVERIESGAFAVNGIETLHIGKSVNYIANDAFIDSTRLQSIVVNSENQVYDSRNNCNAIIETLSNKVIKGIPNTAIPDSVKIIGTNAFVFIGYEHEVTSNKYIILPESIQTIEENAFSNSGIENIFYNGSSQQFENIIGKDNVLNIELKYSGSWRLVDGEPVDNILYDNGYYYIEDNKAYFYSINDLLDIIIPTEIDGYPLVQFDEKSFYNHVNATVFFEGTEEEWNSINRLDNPWRVYFYIDTKVNYPSQYGQYWHYVDGKPEILFKENTNYAYWIIPEIECTELALYKGTEENVIIPDYFEDAFVYSIYTGTFKDNENIKSIRINGQLRTKSIENCDNLEYLIISNMCVMFDQNSVVNCEKLTTIYYEDSQDRWNETFQYSNKSWLEGCEIYYYSETEPTSEGDYWHYVDGKPVVWPIVLSYNVNFYVEGSLYHTEHVIHEDRLNLPVNPTKEGYNFVGWYYEEYGFMWDSSLYTVIYDMTLTAVFEKEVIDLYIYEFPQNQINNNLKFDINLDGTYSLIVDFERDKSFYITSLDGSISYRGYELLTKEGAEDWGPTIGITAAGTFKIEVKDGKVNVYLLEEKVFEYNEYDNYVEITKYMQTDEILVEIPDTYKDKPITHIASNAFSEYKNLVTLIMGKNIKYIGENAFYNGVDEVLDFFYYQGTLDDWFNIQFEDNFILTFGIISVLDNNGNSIYLKNTPDISIQTLKFPNIDTPLYMNCLTGIDSTGIIIPADISEINMKNYTGSNITNIYIEGPKEEFNPNIICDLLGPTYLESLYYFYSETTPTTEGNFWHYVDGKPVVWK